MELDNGLFHCFNCGAKGDIITFVQLRDGVDFITAAKKLGALPSLDKHESARFRREAARRKARRKRIETAVTKLDAMERELRQQYPCAHLVCGAETYAGIGARGGTGTGCPWR